MEQLLQENESYVVAYRQRNGVGNILVFGPSIGSDLAQAKFWRNVVENDYGLDSKPKVMKLVQVDL